MFSLFSSTFANNSLSPLYVVYEARLHFDAFVVTALSATYAVGVLVALLCFGGLSDRIGRRPVLIVGAALVLASTVAFLVATDVVLLFCGRAVLGIATGMLTAAGAAALVELDSTRDRGLAARRTTLSLLAGTAVGPLVAGVVAQTLPGPTRTIFLVEVVLQAAGLIATCLLREPAALMSSRGALAPRRPSVPRGIRAPFLICSMVVSTGWMLGGIYAALSGTLDRQLLHLRSHATAGVVLFIFAAFGGLAQQLARRAATRVAMSLGLCAAGLGVLMMVLALVNASTPIFICATAVSGVGNGLCFSSSLALCNEIAPPTQRAEVVAAYSVVMYATLVVPVVGLGLLVGRIGLEHATIGYAAAVLAMVLAVFFALRRGVIAPPASGLHGDNIAAQ